MTNNPEIGACFAARTSAVRTHQDELLAEAEAWRQARLASQSDSKPGLRRTVGLALVRVGRSLAGEPNASRTTSKPTTANRTHPA
jgi:hypothetical protein